MTWMKSGYKNLNINLNQTMKLIKIIGSPFISEDEKLDNCESTELYNIAIKNKIPLLYLQALDHRDELNKLKDKYQKEIDKYNKFLNTTIKVAKLLNENNINYAIIKTLRPFPYVPGDIDVLILDDEEHKKAIRILLENRYLPELTDLVDITNLKTDKDYEYAVRILTTPTYGGEHGLKHVSPTGCDFIDPETNVPIDLQKELAISYVIYMDKNKFDGKIINVNISGIDVRKPCKELDLAIVIIHSLTEQLYLLGEYYTFLYTLSEMSDKNLDSFIEIIYEHKMTKIVSAFVTITSTLHNVAHGFIPEKLQFLLDEFGINRIEHKALRYNNFKMPHRYSLLTTASAFVEKFKDKRFKTSVLTQLLKTVSNPKLMKLVIKELTIRRVREYYIKEWVLIL